MRPTFDLQSHSLHSDGEFPPAEVVRAAAAAGVELLALTDHDSVGGVEEALAEGPRAGVRVIPATELSLVDEAYEELHILGYLVDHRDAAFAATLEDLRGDRERRVLAMADLLRAEGFALEDTELRRRQAAGDPLGRPHLAHALLDHPDNAAADRRRGDRQPEGAVSRYLVPGVPTYVARTRPTVARGDRADPLGRRRRGVGAPLLGRRRARDWCARCSSASPRSGSMAWRPSTPPTPPRRWGCCASSPRSWSLLTTGSSDFHGSEHKTFAGFRAFELYGQHRPVWGRSPPRPLPADPRAAGREPPPYTLPRAAGRVRPALPRPLGLLFRPSTAPGSLAPAPPRGSCPARRARTRRAAPAPPVPRARAGSRTRS